MKILIATGIYPPDIGGPARYAKNLADEFSRQGNSVRVLVYKLEKKLPTGIRHLLYFFRILLHLYKNDLIIAFDTFSVGLPAVLAAKIFKKKIFVRIGGDFLWESYVERSGNLMSLKQFNEKIPALSAKERTIFSLTKFALKNCTACVFTTEWQKNIFEKSYNLPPLKLFVTENFYGEKIPDLGFKEKNFLWAGRPLKLKNLKILKLSFNEALKENSGIKLEISGAISYNELLQKIQRCYAVILPSLSDASPNFILDAVRADKPFILTKETGLYDKFRDIGFFIDPLNKEDIKSKILFLAEDKNYEKCKNKIKTFNFTHSWRQIANEYLAIYKNL